MEGVIVVTRHQGLLEWLRSHYPELMEGAEIIPHASAEQVRGKIVVGNLPPALAAEALVIYAPTYEVPAELRGKELSAEDLEGLGCKLEGFRVARTRVVLEYVTIPVWNGHGDTIYTAEVIASASGGDREDGTWWQEKLCRAIDTGDLYLMADGGENSKYGFNPDGVGVDLMPGGDIMPFSYQQAWEWLEANGLDTALLDYNG